MASNHSFVLATIRLTLRRATRKDQRPPPINVESLKDTQVKTTFQTEVRNRFAVLENQKGARAEGKAYTERPTEEAETAASKQNMQTLAADQDFGRKV